MNFKWNLEKNALLKIERGVCFEDVVSQIYEDNVLDIIQHPNTQKYPEQKIYIILLQNYVHMIPFVKTDDEIFLKTIVPSRKMHKLYVRSL
ncbi:MAG: toxin [Campylobacterota bacterium]|nr:toxin [Campylobacterota bacterium]